MRTDVFSGSKRFPGSKDLAMGQKLGRECDGVVGVKARGYVEAEEFDVLGAIRPFSG
jgi:hypothetical protein